MTGTLLLSPSPLPGTQGLLVCSQASQHCPLPYTHQHIFGWSTNTSCLKERKKRRNTTVCIIPCFWGPWFCQQSGLHPHLPTHTCLSEGLPQVGLHRLQRVEGFFFSLVLLLGNKTRALSILTVCSAPEPLVHTNSVFCPWAAPKVWIYLSLLSCI